MGRRSVLLPSLISFVGVAIVIATFIVKDIVRDDLRSLQAALREGESTYLVVSSIFFTRADIADLRIELAQLKNDELRKVPQQEINYIAMGAVFKKHLDYATDQLHFMDGRVEAYIKVLEILPASDEYRAKLKTELDSHDRLISEADELKSLSDTVSKQIEKLKAQYRASPSEANRLSEEMYHEAEKLAPHVNAFTADVGQSQQNTTRLMSDAVQNAKVQEGILQRRYTLVSRTSYCLFIIGAIVSFIGQIVALRASRD